MIKFILFFILYKLLTLPSILVNSKTLTKMEHHAQSVDDALIGGLSYKLKAGASYITNRRSVSYFASGGNQYSPNGVRVIKFNITGDQWLDSSTFVCDFSSTTWNMIHLVQNISARFHGTLLFSLGALGLLQVDRRSKILMISIVCRLCLPLLNQRKNSLELLQKGLVVLMTDMVLFLTIIVKNTVVVVLIHLALFVNLVVLSLHQCLVFSTKINCCL